MRKMIIIFAILFLCLITTGCYAQNTETNTKSNGNNIINQLIYGKPVRVTFAIDNNIYEVTNVVVTQEELGGSIGSVNREVSPKPEKNGDIARNTSEGPAIIGDNGGKLYEIKGVKNREQIALEISKGTYYQSNYIGQLK